MQMAPSFRPQITVVDDDAEVQSTLKGTLRGLGCDVLSVFTAEEAWAVLTSGKINVDVIVLDWELPLGMSGPALNKRIKAHENLKSIPVVYYTANWDPKSLHPAYIAWLGSIVSLQNDMQKFTDAVIAKKGIVGPPPGLLLNIAEALEGRGRPVPVEMKKAVDLLIHQGYNAADEVERLGKQKAG